MLSAVHELHMCIEAIDRKYSLGKKDVQESRPKHKTWVTAGMLHKVIMQRLIKSMR